MQRRLLDILACPVDKHYPLEMLELQTRADDIIVEGILVCSECGRYYPITEEIAVMLPDGLRTMKEDLAFLEKWKERIPQSVLTAGKPWSLSTATDSGNQL